MGIDYRDPEIQAVDLFEDTLHVLHIDYNQYREFGHPMHIQDPFLEGWLRKINTGERFILSYDPKNKRIQLVSTTESTSIPVSAFALDCGLTVYIWQKLQTGQRLLVQGRTFQDKIVKGIISIFTEHPADNTHI
jgi:hypothetical protein